MAQKERWASQDRYPLTFHASAMPLPDKSADGENACCGSAVCTNRTRTAPLCLQSGEASRKAHGGEGVISSTTVAVAEGNLHGATALPAPVQSSGDARTETRAVFYPFLGR